METLLLERTFPYSLLHTGAISFQRGTCRQGRFSPIFNLIQNLLDFFSKKCNNDAIAGKGAPLTLVGDIFLRWVETHRRRSRRMEREGFVPLRRFPQGLEYPLRAFLND
jgi:hypothetical protein